MTSIGIDKMIRVLIEGPEGDMEAIAKFLRTIANGNKPAWVPTSDQRESLTSIAAAITRRLQEEDPNKRFHIWVQGRRRLIHGFRKSPDFYVGSDYGRDFYEACRNYFYDFPLYGRERNTFMGCNLYPGDAP